MSVALDPTPTATLSKVPRHDGLERGFTRPIRAPTNSNTTASKRIASSRKSSSSQPATLSNTSYSSPKTSPKLSPTVPKKAKGSNCTKQSKPKSKISSLKKKSSKSTLSSSFIPPNASSTTNTLLSSSLPSVLPQVPTRVTAKPTTEPCTSSQVTSSSPCSNSFPSNPAPLTTSSRCSTQSIVTLHKDPCSKIVWVPPYYYLDVNASSLSPTTTSSSSLTSSYTKFKCPKRKEERLSSTRVSSSSTSSLRNDSVFTSTSSLPSPNSNFTFSCPFENRLQSLSYHPLSTSMWYPALILVPPKKLSSQLKPNDLYVSFLDNRSTTIVPRDQTLAFTGQDELLNYYATYCNEELSHHLGVQNAFSLLARLDTPTSIFTRHKKRRISQREVTGLSRFFYAAENEELPSARRRKLSSTTTALPSTKMTIPHTSSLSSNRTPSLSPLKSSEKKPVEPVSSSFQFNHVELDDLSSVPPSPSPSPTPSPSTSFLQENSKLLSTLHPCIRTSEHRYQQHQYVLDCLKVQGDDSKLITELKKLQMEYKVIRLVTANLFPNSMPSSSLLNKPVPLNPSSKQDESSSTDSNACSSSSSSSQPTSSQESKSDTNTACPRRGTRRRRRN